MITMETIRRELNDIKYYYARQEQFDRAFDSVGKNEILRTVEKYNRAVCAAEPGRGPLCYPDRQRRAEQQPYTAHPRRCGV